MSFNFNWLSDSVNYDSRKVARLEKEDNGGIGVSTAWTSDEGYETALLDSNGVHPVERYYTLEDAKVGHEKWVDFAKDGNGKEVNKLFWSDMPYMNEVIILEA